jgi:cyclopropane-fatty-acyl-phospholipid synthase
MLTDESVRYLTAETRAPVGVAAAVAPLLRIVFGSQLPVRIEFWDGSGIGPWDGPGTLHVRSSDALRRLLWAPGQLGLSRAFVVGELDLEGDIFELLRVLRAATPDQLRLGPGAVASTLGAIARLRILPTPPPPPGEEARPRGRRHSRRRDAEVVSHHYDVGNDFYRLILGPSMTYSCARFSHGSTTLEEAQAAKHEMICRKLGLHERPGLSLLDVGCGWGSMAMHAAAHHGATVVGVTISQAQAERSRKRVADAGLTDQVEIRLQDYRDLEGETFDAISSIGMFEHVGAKRIATYFETLRALLGPRGRVLNHAISSVGGSTMEARSFIGRYVWPDGELIDLGDVVLAMERAGFEVRDVESLREHYAGTLRAWVANLDAGWDQALAEVGPNRARIWRLYMAGSALSFEAGDVGIHQVLGVVADGSGGSGMPATRDAWATGPISPLRTAGA